MVKNWKIRKDLNIEVYGHTLFRIECTKDFAEIKAGTLGGYIEKEENLDGNLLELMIKVIPFKQ